MKKEKLFTTKDIYLATTLVSLKNFINNIDFQYEGNNRKLVAYFSFSDNDLVRKTVDKYFRRELAIEPNNFIMNLKGLKSQISSVFKNPHIDR